MCKYVSFVFLLCLSIVSMEYFIFDNYKYLSIVLSIVCIEYLYLTTTSIWALYLSIVCIEYCKYWVFYISVLYILSILFEYCVPEAVGFVGTCVAHTLRALLEVQGSARGLVCGVSEVQEVLLLQTEPPCVPLLWCISIVVIDIMRHKIQWHIFEIIAK